MDHNFRDRKHKVLAVDPSGGSRTLLTEVIRSTGFSDAQAVPSLKDAMGILEVEQVTWIITSVFPDQEANLFQLLRLCCEVPDLKDLRVSVFVDENEMEFIPGAFEKGLLSYHKKPFTRDYLKQEFENLLADYEKVQWDSSMLAASYLRKCLTGIGNFDELLGFERQLMNAQPGNIHQVLNLAIPLIKTNKVDEAKAVLLQVQKLDPTLEKQVKAIVSAHLNNADLGEVKGNVNLLGLKSAVIVDNDSTVQTELKATLNEMGVEDVHIFNDGMSALEFVQKNAAPDLIIHEWKLPKLTGPLFLQRAREGGASATPFILYSSLIDKADTPFLREMGVAHTVQKPTPRPELIKNIIWTVQQDRSPSERTALERKFRQAIAAKDLTKAEEIAGNYLNDASIGLGPKQLVEAELSYAKAQYEKARDLSVEAIKNAGDSIFVLNLLGKTMIQLRDLETALKCFQRAQQIAPLNMERLCQIAEIQAEVGDAKKAEEILSQVEGMDPDTEKPDESRAKIALNAGDMNKAKQIMGELKAAENVVSYMNNRAIALARCGKVDDGIEEYKKTLQAIPDNRQDIIGVVHFNMALAYLRANVADEALKYLEQSTKSPSLKMQERAAKLIKKVRYAQSKGLPIQMGVEKTPEKNDKAEKRPSDAAATAQATQQSVVATVEARPGERGCYMIYKSNLKNPGIVKMLENNIHFVVRKAITRSEAGGADKLNASGN